MTTLTGRDMAGTEWRDTASTGRSLVDVPRCKKTRLTVGQPAWAAAGRVAGRRPVPISGRSRCSRSCSGPSRRCWWRGRRRCRACLPVPPWEYGAAVSQPAMVPPTLALAPAMATSMPGRGPPCGIAAWQLKQAMRWLLRETWVAKRELVKACSWQLMQKVLAGIPVAGPDEGVVPEGVGPLQDELGGRAVRAVGVGGRVRVVAVGAGHEAGPGPGGLDVAGGAQVAARAGAGPGGSRLRSRRSASWWCPVVA